MSNVHLNGPGDATQRFDRPVDYLNVFVPSGQTLSINVLGPDNTELLTISEGFHSFYIGPTKFLAVQSSGGNWSILARRTY